MERSASAVADGSLLVYYLPFKAVLVNYPTQDELTMTFSGDNKLYRSED